jgi:hypothetical protein
MSIYQDIRVRLAMWLIDLAFVVVPVGFFEILRRSSGILPVDIIPDCDPYRTERLYPPPQSVEGS